MSFYTAAQALVRWLWPLIGRRRVLGLENVPETGPFLLIANHQSYLDPVLIQAVVPREVHTLAKSIQFTAPLIGRFLVAVHSIPARRFEVDPQSVRLALRRLSEGHGVGIYIEGERSWDARLQPPRLGTVRLALKAGVPVVPCGISGTYDVLPRWDGRLRRGTITIRFGAQIHLPQLDDREARERALPEARKRIMGALRRLSASE